MAEKKKEIVKLLFLLMPVVSYILFEYVTGNLLSIGIFMAMLNIAWLFVIYLAVFAVAGNTRIAVPIVSGVVWMISVAEAFVVSFRTTPIMIWDVMAFRTAIGVAGNYVFDFTKEMKLSAAAVIIINILLWFIPFQVKGWKKRFGCAVGSTAAIVGFVTWFYAGIVPGHGMEISMWDMGVTYEYYGYLLSTAVSLKYVINHPPEGYSRAVLLGLYHNIVEESYLPQGDNRMEKEIQPVNLICIMNESLSELKTSGDFTTNTEYFPFMNSLRENVVKGSLCVPVFGAFTSNTEFEFLTGDSMVFLPTGSNAFQIYVKPGTSSLVSTLKDQGYDTLAMHPYPAIDWNRDDAYPNLGFDRFVYGAFEGEYYGECDQLRNYVSDQADYEKIIEEVEKKENPDDKLFIFNVTMQNHGGYDMIFDNFNQEVWLTGRLEGKYPRTDQYLSLMRESDKALEYLIGYFEACREPTMIVMFGDHQPGVEDEFFDDVSGMPSSEVPLNQQIMWFETPFLIWTNYEQPYEEMGRLGSIYLSSYLLKLANLEMPPYNQFLLNMSEEVPVVHPIGCYTPDGTYYKWREVRDGQCPASDMIQDYEYLAYNHILDSRIMEELFYIDPERK